MDLSETCDTKWICPKVCNVNRKTAMDLSKLAISQKNCRETCDKKHNYITVMHEMHVPIQNIYIYINIYISINKYINEKLYL